MAKKKKEPRDLDEREIGKELKEIDEKVFRLRFQLSMGQTDGIKRIREMKKDRARLLTERRAREIAAASGTGARKA